MFSHPSRYPLALSLAAILAVGTAFGAAAAAEGPNGPDALTATSAPAAQAQGIGPGPEASLDSGDIVMPFKYNQAGPENLAPTRHNRGVDRGTGD
jgi:hypothetical protein